MGILKSWKKTEILRVGNEIRTLLIWPKGRSLTDRPDIYYDWSRDKGPLSVPFDSERLPVESRINVDSAPNPDDIEWLDYVQSMVTQYIGRSQQVLTMSQDLQILSWQYRILKKRVQLTALYGWLLTIYVMYLQYELRKFKREG